MTKNNIVRTQPCAACPYRTDVPSGVWQEHEYEKLRDYDDPTFNQPVATFQCHASPEFYCHGWAVCHSNRGHEYDLLAFRFWPPDSIPEAAVPLFESGNAAADHGERDIDNPPPEAHAMMSTLLGRYERLRESNL